MMKLYSWVYTIDRKHLLQSLEPRILCNEFGNWRDVISQGERGREGWTDETLESLDPFASMKIDRRHTRYFDL